MDDNDVCPLCCEELDISDRSFFPCKCGYQVCMWCWHRIKEQETGLCPACRTPYGDDPHEFSAVDVEEVLKEKAEKEEAAKRERDRLRQQQANAAGSSGGGIGDSSGHGLSSGGSGGLHQRGSSFGAGNDDSSMGSAGSRSVPMELPRDRNALANMRVIRRNLVYAVGLPPNIGGENELRKPEYFGQYGKIAKIVVNRNNAVGGDPRRASTSAYVTFSYKEDALACILVLDGFFIDGRSVRASFGTSKYCSAFIKNVRCNNPECTYLHSMGDAEDTFTKQEIQAGYVTSGRDVLARQQQLVQQGLAASGGVGGSRQKIGGGGPSGTGKASSNPILPQPSYDEHLSRPTNSLGVSSTGTLNRSSSIGASATATRGRSSSVGTSLSPKLESITAPPKGSISAATGGIGLGGSIIGSSTGGATAASVVAGLHSSSTSSSSEPPAPHTTLTPLTPLKRTTAPLSTQQPKTGTTVGLKAAVSSDTGISSSGVDSVQLPPNMPVPKGLTPQQREALLEQRKEAMAAMARQQREMALKLSALRNGGTKPPNNGGIGTTSSGTAAPTSPIPKPANNSNTGFSVGSIGGAVIGGAAAGGGPSNNSGFSSSAIGSLGGQPIVGVDSLNKGPNTSSSIGGIGGDVYNGPALSSSNIIGGNTDKWNPQPSSSSSNSGLFSNNNDFTLGSGGIWNGDSTSGSGAIGGASNSSTVVGPSAGVIGGTGKAVGTIGGHGPIGGGNIIGGTSLNSNSGGFNTGSSALASMLGINLPTGSGSLQASTSLWESSNAPAPSQHPIGSIGGPAAPGVIGSSSGSKPANTPIGGFTIGGGGMPASGGGGGFPSTGGSIAPNPVGGSNISDIAMLQNLLPGVHITSGSSQQPTSAGSFGSVGGSGWTSVPGPPGSSQPPIGGLNAPVQQANTWGGAIGVQSTGTPVGAPGQPNQKQGQSSIW